MVRLSWSGLLLRVAAGVVSLSVGASASAACSDLLKLTLRVANKTQEESVGR